MARALHDFTVTVSGNLRLHTLGCVLTMFSVESIGKAKKLLKPFPTPRGHGGAFSLVRTTPVGHHSTS